MSRRERIVTDDGDDITIDHDAKTITGRRVMPRPGPCPQKLLVRTEFGTREAKCLGESGHITPGSPKPVHMDRDGRKWE
jgi:hypothetical protein